MFMLEPLGHGNHVLAMGKKQKLIVSKSVSYYRNNILTLCPSWPCMNHVVKNILKKDCLPMANEIWPWPDFGHGQCHHVVWAMGTLYS